MKTYAVFEIITDHTVHSIESRKFLVHDTHLGYILPLPTAQYVGDFKAELAAEAARQAWRKKI